MKVGPRTDPATRCGPMIIRKAVQKIDRLVTDVVDRGARVITGGAPLDGAGFYYPPTLLDNVPRDTRIANEEIFGPVAPVYRFRTEDEAIYLANATEYGLAAHVCTTDLIRGLRVSRAIEAGMAGLNRGLMSDLAAPFGGVKKSGLGREGGVAGILEFTEATYIAVDF